MEKITKTQVLDFIRGVQLVLNVAALPNAPKGCWAKEWVNARMEFHSRFSGGRIFTTEHGVDFFENTALYLSGKANYAVNGKDHNDREYAAWLKSLA